MRKGLLVGLMLALMLITALPVFAVLSCIATDTCLILSNEGAPRWDDWVAIETTLEPGLFTGATAVTTYNTLGWYANGYTPSPFQFIGVRYVFEEPTCVEEYQINIESLGVVETQILLAVRRGETWSIVFQDYDYPATTFSWEGTVGGEPVDEIQIQHYGDDPAIRLVAFTGGGDACVPPPEYPDWYRPLTDQDEADEFPLYDLTAIRTLSELQLFGDWNLGRPQYEVFSVVANGGPETVHAYSDLPGAKVHAATGGTVESIKPLFYDDCGMGYWALQAPDENPEDDEILYYPFRANQNQPCYVQQYRPELIGTYETYPDWEGYSGLDSVYLQNFYLDPTDGYIVTLRIDTDIRISYLVRNALNYVVVGDVIQEGCILGETLGLTGAPVRGTNWTAIGIGGGLAVTVFSGGSLAWLAPLIQGGAELANALIPDPQPVESPLGYTVITLFGVDDALQPLAPALTLSPTSDDTCAGIGVNSDCVVANPEFDRNGDTWLASGNVQWTNPGVILDPNEMVYTQVNIDPESNYVVTLYAQSVNGLESEIRVFLGSNTQRITSPVEWTSIQLSTSPVGEPDAGLFHTVGFQNTGTNPIEVRSLCLTDGEPEIAPGSCYFNNHSFSGGTSGWTVSEDVEWDGDQSLLVPDLETFSQNVELFPKSSGPATYKLAVYANWWYTGTIDAIATANLAYEWPSGTGYVNMVPQLVSGGLGYGLGTILFTAEIEVEEATNALMNFRVDTTDAGSMGLQGLMIGDACLSPVGGGPWPGQGGNTAPPAVNPSCFYIARPRNNDPAAWLQWHWLNTEKVLKCELMVLLGRMEKTMVNAYTLFGWQARYMQSTLRVYSSWAGEQLFPWLNGHFRNIAIGQVTTIYQSGGQCSDLFCLVNNLFTSFINYLTPFTDTFINILNSLVGILIGSANLLFTVFGGIVAFVLALVVKMFSFLNMGTSLLATIITAFNSSEAIPIPGLPMCSVDPEGSLFCRAMWVLDNTAFEGRWGVIFVIIIAIASIHLILWTIGEVRNILVKMGGSS